MTSINISMPEEVQNRHKARQDGFWQQTVGENNLRLDGLNTPKQILDEIKFIESVLLSLVKPEGADGLGTYTAGA